jgi:hypothetical protein
LIPAGATSGSITISAVDDALDEPDETLIVDIAGVTNGVESGTQSVTLLIADDDEPAVPAPTVTAFAPSANSHIAPQMADFAVSFDEPIDATTAHTMTFAVHSLQSGQLVGSAASVATAGNTVTLTPSETFHPGELLQASVTPGIQSTTGEPAEPFVWRVRSGVEAGSGTFRTHRDRFGSDNAYISRPALGDLDGDGDLDAFVLASFTERGNRVWINEDGQFTATETRLGNAESLGVALGDLDGDGDLDAFVANRDQGNRVWINTGGTYGSDLFSDSGQSLGDHFGTGVALGDLVERWFGRLY